MKCISYITAFVVYLLIALIVLLIVGCEAKSSSTIQNSRACIGRYEDLSKPLPATGMSREQVLGSSLGTPLKVSNIDTANGELEIWYYGEAGEHPMIFIHNGVVSTIAY